MKRKELILARHKMEMTQKQVAEKIGVSQDRYSRFENNKANPSLVQTQLIIKY